METKFPNTEIKFIVLFLYFFGVLMIWVLCSVIYYIIFFNPYNFMIFLKSHLIDEV